MSKIKKKTALFISSIALLRINTLFQERKTNGISINAEKILIMGGGGTLGAIWQVGSLLRLIEEGSLDLNNFDLRVCTSAGSLALAVVDSDLSFEEIDQLIANSQIEHKGKTLRLPDTEYRKDKGRLNNPRILLNGLKYLQLPRFNNILSGFIPEGAASLEPLGNFIDDLHGDWPEKATFVVASDLDSGRRVVFNKLSNVKFSDAVKASCSVPGVFKPININNTRYIDGGVHSSINYDLAVKARAKEIFILTSSTGFTRIRAKDKPLVLVSKIYRNLMEIHLRRIEFFCKAKGVKLTILRPRDSEKEILLKSGSLLNEDHMIELYLQSKKRV